MLARITALMTLLIAFSSCQREGDDISPRPNNDVLLVKTVTVIGTGSSPYDTAIITYDYDANDRLAKETFFFVFATSSGLQRLPIGREYTRDGANRIIRIQGNNRLVANPMNVVTSFSNVFYVDNTSTKVSYISDDNNSFKTVYTYNSNGRIGKTETFQHFPLPTDPLKMVVYYTHQYDASGNLLSRTQYSDNDNNGVFEQAIAYTFEYDAMLNPLGRDDDALLEWRWLATSPANYVKHTNNYGGAMPVDGHTMQYQYRSDKKPERATRTDFGNFVSGTSITTYYYQ